MHFTHVFALFVLKNSTFRCFLYFYLFLILYKVTITVAFLFFNHNKESGSLQEFREIETAKHIVGLVCMVCVSLSVCLLDELHGQLSLLE